MYLVLFHKSMCMTGRSYSSSPPLRDHIFEMEESNITMEDSNITQKSRNSSLSYDETLSLVSGVIKRQF